MEEVKKIRNEYQMGFITAQEFLAKLSDILYDLGSSRELVDTTNTILAPFVDFIIDKIIDEPILSNKKQINEYLNDK